MEFGCEPVVVAAPADYLDEAQRFLGTRVVQLVEGGPTRQQSVANALDKISTELVLVHDAARPFVQAEVVEATLDALSECDGAVPIVQVHDTVKEVADDRVVRTVERDDLGLAQNPQAFRTNVLRAAHERARANRFEATDDAQLVENYGGTVRTVAGSPRNLKLTYPEDFAVAEALIRA